ncbi:MAG TPA: UDP-N-acetylmuramate--L-alanine ligase [Candidatus Limnocylindria bacterium]
MTRYHVVGIGGAGMSAVARVLLARGHAVSGSDSGSWPLAEALARDGATVHASFAAEHVAGADVVIRSSAYRADNVEVRSALDRGIPVWKRDDAWRELTKGQRVVAIAGTHGKSTTTAMTWMGLRAAGLDASLICGAVLRELGTNAYAGSADTFVIEADEYDNAFLALTPSVAVVTTLDHDHIDIFPTKASYRDAFRAFAARTRERGALIVGVSDAGGRELALWAKRELGDRTVHSYGTEDADILVRYEAGTVRWSGDDGSFHLAVPGAHNAMNATAAILAADALGVDRARATSGVGRFDGVSRRLELLGTSGAIRVVDDYAHHPAEIAAGLDAEGEDLVVFQPHTPSRLDAFFDDFVAVLKRPRAVVIVETFRSAREAADPHGRAKKLADAVGGRYAPDAETAARIVTELARPGDTVLVMGAGDVRPVGERVLELLRAPV